MWTALMYVYIYIYTYIHTYIYISKYIFVYLEVIKINVRHIVTRYINHEN